MEQTYIDRLYQLLERLQKAKENNRHAANIEAVIL